MSTAEIQSNPVATPDASPSHDSSSGRRRFGLGKGKESALVRDFQPHTLAIQESPPSPFARTMLWGLAALFAAIGAWSYASRLPIMTTAPGKFAPGAHTKVIQSLDTGTVAEILVKPGDQVKKGQVLVKLNPQVDQAALAARTRMLALDILEEQRLHAELSGNPASMGARGATPGMANLEKQLEQTSLAHETAKIAGDLAQVREAEANLAAGQATLAEYAQRAMTDERLAKAAAPLVSEGALSGSHYDQIADQATREVGKLAAQRKQVVQLQEALTAAQKQLNGDREGFKKKRYQDLETAVNNQYDLTRKKTKAARQYQLDWLRAPVAGTVQSVDVASLGTVVQSGQTLATVVPENAPLVVDADLPAQDMGFVQVGQETQIKVTAYPFEQYGNIPGKVVWISPNAETSNSLEAPPPGESHQGGHQPQPAQSKSGDGRTKPASPPTLYYRVKVQPERAWLLVDNEKRPMQAGMTATVDIRTGTRRVLDFFLDPIVKYFNNGLEVR